jgi:hypothetical protein
MANLASTAVTPNRWFYTNARVGSRQKAVNVTLVLTAQGGTTNKILASTLGLITIEDATPFTASDNSAVAVAAPSADGTFLLLGTTPADVTGTYSGTVFGQAL